MKRSAIVYIPIGLHARPAMNFTEKACQFESEITLVLGDRAANGKSVMGVMSLALGYGERVTIKAEGPDEQLAIDTLVELLEDFKE